MLYKNSVKLLNLRTLVCLIVIFQNVEAADRFLERESIVYGLATVTNSSNTKCDLELRVFSEALESQEDWAIKSKFFLTLLFLSVYSTMVSWQFLGLLIYLIICYLCQ